MGELGMRYQRYISPYRLWHELHRFIPKESEVEEG